MKAELEIDVKSLFEMLKGDEPPLILDVREPDEIQLASLKGSRKIPFSLLPQQYTTLDKKGKWVVICHHGYRSLQATLFLKSKGFIKVRNVKGGIDAWSLQIDATVPRY